MFCALAKLLQHSSKIQKCFIGFHSFKALKYKFNWHCWALAHIGFWNLEFVNNTSKTGRSFPKDFGTLA
jgi:hypothetical protein